MPFSFSSSQSRVAMSDTARRIVRALEGHTPFAEAIVRRQTERAGIPVETMEDADLPRVMPYVVAAASTFVDPDVLRELKGLK
jgi:hypothetical protein